MAGRAGAADGTYDEVFRVVRPDGAVRWLHDRAFPVRDESGKAYRIAGIAEDVTERKLAEQQLTLLAHYDELTGLPNRTMFNERLSHALAHARRTERSLAVLFIDLDRFKNINDTLGHEAGDRVLKEVARPPAGLPARKRHRGASRRRRVRRADRGAAAARERSRGRAEDPRRHGYSRSSFRRQEFHITASIGISTLPRRRR